MTYKVSVTGIDGCGKSTSISNVVDSLASEYLTAKIGRPTYISGPGIFGGRKYLFSGLNKKIDILHTFADNLENRLCVASVNIFNAFVWSFINNKILMGFNPQIAIYGRDRVIDPAVYATFYFPSTKNWSSQTRLKIAEKISRSKTSDIIIYMDIDPAIAVERIERRIEEEKKKSGIDRKKWRHMHENLQDLTSLKDYYTDALDYLLGHSDIDVQTIEVNEKSLQDISKEMESIIRNRMSDH